MTELEEAHQRAVRRGMPGVPGAFAWMITKLNKTTKDLYYPFLLLAIVFFFKCFLMYLRFLTDFIGSETLSVAIKLASKAPISR
jgi:hypothetical protein